MEPTEVVAEAAPEEEGGLDIGGAVAEALGSVKDGLIGVVSSFDLLGLGLITEDSEVISEEIGAGASVYKQIAAHFTVYSAFAYLLFVLMYFPCLAVVGAARQEMGAFYAGVMALYSTALAWSVATLFYQIAEGHNFMYILLSFAVLAGIYGTLYVIGKREQADSVAPVFAPPIRRDCC